QAEDGIRDLIVTGVQTCALPILVGVSVVALQGWAAATLLNQNPTWKVLVGASAASGSNPKIWSNSIVLIVTLAVPSDPVSTSDRSEERRVGKECRARWGGEVDVE